MKRRIGVAAVVAGACALAVTVAGPAVSANAVTTGVATGAVASASAALRTLDAPTGLNAPWARELTRYGASDVSPYHIAHVRELQYRLKWVGLFPAGAHRLLRHGDPRRACRAFQARRHLPVTGNANAATWKLLLQRTVRNPAGIPATCKTAGWHACYDRTVPPVTLWDNGSIYNTWLVRGGGSTTQTRLGTHLVYYRDIDHVSGSLRLADAVLAVLRRR